MKQETIDRIRKFTEDRDWDQFHSPANLAKSIVIEAAELLECFQWSDEEYDLQHIKEELADVMVYSQNLLDKLGLDADEIINIPDIDSTGIDAGKDLALSYLEIKTAWIPEELYNRKNRNLKQLKDFTDFIKFKYNPDDRDYSKILKEKGFFHK